RAPCRLFGVVHGTSSKGSSHSPIPGFRAYGGHMPGGRRPFHAVDVQPWYDGDQRLRPPACLGPREREVFLDLISTLPLGHFQASDLGLISRWCEASVMAEQAAQELRAQGLVVNSGKTGPKVSPWFSIFSDATK